jgi:hypothetical protein
VIAFAAAVPCLLTCWLRFALGAWAPAVPWIGLAWTLVFARHSRRAAFAAFALLLGLIDGFTAPAPLTVWPIAYLVAGTAAYGTRRVLPVRSAGGEMLLGALATALVRAIALPFDPLGLELSSGPWAPWAVGAALTGACSAGLVLLARRWAPLRMRLLSVT